MLKFWYMYTIRFWENLTLQVMKRKLVSEMFSDTDLKVHDEKQGRNRRFHGSDWNIWWLLASKCYPQSPLQQQFPYNPTYKLHTDFRNSEHQYFPLKCIVSKIQLIAQSLFVPTKCSVREGPHSHLVQWCVGPADLPKSRQVFPDDDSPLFITFCPIRMTAYGRCVHL